DRELHRFATQRLDRTLPVALDLLARTRDDLLLLLPRTIQHVLAHALRRLLPFRNDLLRLLPRVQQLLPLLRQQLLALLALPPRLVQCVLDALLTRRRIPEDRRERPLRQHDREQNEDDQRPERHAGVDAEDARRLSGLGRDRYQIQSHST